MLYVIFCFSGKSGVVEEEEEVVPQPLTSIGQVATQGTGTEQVAGMGFWAVHDGH